MIPQAVPSLTPLERANLLEAIDSGFVSTVGPFVPRFERALAEAAGAEASVATSSGTAGLHLALLAAGVERDDLVIVPSYTFVASANAVAYCGAEPWFGEISADSWTLDSAALERQLREGAERRQGVCHHKATGRRVAAILPVYTLGQPAEMEAIGELAEAFGLPVVADAAAALGATYRGRRLGALADFSVFSFNGNKTITTGGGGAVVARDPERLARVRHLASVARSGSDYEYDAVGFNYRMTNLHAAVGCAQLDRRDELVGRKRAIRRRYDEALSNLPGASCFPAPAWSESACWLSGIVLGDAAPGFDALAAALRDAGIEAREFWRPIHLQKPYRHCPRAEVARSEDLWRRILILPSSADLSDDEQSHTIDTLRAAWG